MLKLSALLTSAYLFYASSAIAAEEEHELSTEHSIDAANYAEAVLAASEEGLHAEAHTDKGGLPQFDPEWFASQIFWLVIAFSLLYVIFAKKTLPEISGVIENRKNHIQSNLDSAEKLTTEADEVHDAYVAGLEKSQAKAAEEVQKAEAKMKKKATKAMDDFRERSEVELNAAEARIEAAKTAAMGDMNAIATDAANVAVEKIIGTTDATKVKAIVENMNGKAKAA